MEAAALSNTDEPSSTSAAPHMRSTESSSPDRVPSRINNFDLLRLVFAWLVIVSHSFGLLGLPEPHLWGRTLGNLAVHGFFAVSGYLITQSFERNPRPLAFATNRALRIIPGLVVSMIVATLLWSSMNTYASNPVPYISNGVVWTLTWEAVCYAGVGLLGVLTALRPTIFPALFCSAWLLFVVNFDKTTTAYAVVVPLLMSFAGGAFLYVMRSHLKIAKLAIVAAAVLILTASSTVFSAVAAKVGQVIPFVWGPEITAPQVASFLFLAAFPVIVIYLGQHVPRIVRIPHDVSYGVYLYGWPAAQTVIFVMAAWGISQSPYVLMALTFALAIPAAILSWFLVERPFLRLKRRRPPAVAPQRPQEPR